MKNDQKINENTGRKYAQILNVKLNSTSLRSVLKSVMDFISHNSKFTIVTPNPEIILLAQKDRELFKILNSADLAIPDGVGLKLAVPFLKIIKGRKLFLELMALANKKEWRVFLLGGKRDEAQKTADNLGLSLRKIKFAAAAGPVLDNQGKPVSQRDIMIQDDVVEKINRFAPQLLFVGFGAPKQEKWVSKNLAKLKIEGAMTVGGTFAYFSGYSQLPPKWLEDLGLEWFWRLLTEPWRAGRIIKATIIFPLKVLQDKLSR